MDRHEQADLVEAGVNVCASVTTNNAAHGDTFAVLIPRIWIDELERMLERVAPLRVAERRDAREGRG